MGSGRRDAGQGAGKGPGHGKDAQGREHNTKAGGHGAHGAERGAVGERGRSQGHGHGNGKGTGASTAGRGAGDRERARDGHTLVQRRLRAQKERLPGVPALPQPCLLCGGPENTPVHMHVGCAHSLLLWPHYRLAVQEAARHLPPGDKAL